MASWFNAVSQALKDGDVAGALETTKGSLQNAAKNVTEAVDENIKKVREFGVGVRVELDAGPGAGGVCCCRRKT